MAISTTESQLLDQSRLGGLLSPAVVGLFCCRLKDSGLDTPQMELLEWKSADWNQMEVEWLERQQDLLQFDGK